MKPLYRNTINLNWEVNPVEQIQNISKEIIRHADYFPKTLSYEDIDRSFKEWVETKIKIVQDDTLLPTMVLFSNQRFSEYLQTWSYTDENNNIRLNFKTITRENNPKHGTILGETYNIPGEQFYTFKSMQAIDESGVKYRIDYKMKQPTPIDLTYKISVFTNRYTTINSFNEIINSIFNAKHDFISPNGHYMSIVLENIGDESEYNIQDRQFFSQSVNIRVRGYIIKESDFKVEENPIAAVICFEGDENRRKKPTINLYEYDICEEDKNNYKPIDIEIDFSFCWPYKGKTKFTIDEPFILTGIEFNQSNNIKKNNIKLYINDLLITDNLYEEAYEGYKLCTDIPTDISSEDYIICDNIPKKQNKKYKFIQYNNEFYKWHKISFLDGDEIILQTEREKRNENAGVLTLNGYNKNHIE